MTSKREELIALEAAHLTVKSVGRSEGKTYQQIVNEAIAKVDKAEESGKLDFLYFGWMHDPEEN